MLATPAAPTAMPMHSSRHGVCVANTLHWQVTSVSSHQQHRRGCERDHLVHAVLVVVPDIRGACRGRSHTAGPCQVGGVVVPLLFYGQPSLARPIHGPLSLHGSLCFFFQQDG